MPRGKKKEDENVEEVKVVDEVVVEETTEETPKEETPKEETPKEETPKEEPVTEKEGDKKIVSLNQKKVVYSDGTARKIKSRKEHTELRKQR